MSSAINYLQLHTEMIKTSIVISESQVLVGYNIRKKKFVNLFLELGED